EKSFGKGLVQVSRQLSYNSQLKVTTAKYYTPTGRCIQVLDYSHRREDGSVGAIPDSLKRTFKTTNGRTVYDGGGIDPDIQTGNMELLPLAEALSAQGPSFDYANEYAYRHPHPPDPSTFTLSDAEYQRFVNWMKNRSYSHGSMMETELRNLEKELTKERYYDEVKTQLAQIHQAIKQNRDNELMRYKDQIKMLLEQEIAARYYLERGKVEAGIKYD